MYTSPQQQSTVGSRSSSWFEFTHSRFRYDESNTKDSRKYRRARPWAPSAWASDAKSECSPAAFRIRTDSKVPCHCRKLKFRGVISSSSLPVTCETYSSPVLAANVASGNARIYGRLGNTVCRLVSLPDTENLRSSKALCKLFNAWMRQTLSLEFWIY